MGGGDEVGLDGECVWDGLKGWNGWVGGWMGWLDMMIKMGGMDGWVRGSDGGRP